jgi:hypothetical protein
MTRFPGAAQLMTRFPGAAQREAVRCRPGSQTRTLLELYLLLLDPGSAVHRFAPWRVEDVRKRAYGAHAAPHPGHDVEPAS